MQKYMQKKRIFPACLFLMFVLIILVIGKETEMTGRGETQKIRNLSDGWYYLKDGERTEVTLPTTLQEDPGTVLELYNDTVTDENRDMVLLTWGAPYHLQIQMDGKTIYQYRDYGFKRNLQMARKLECRVTLPALHKSSQLCFLYTVPKSGVCKLTPVYMGTSEAIFRFQIMNAAPVFVIVLGNAGTGHFRNRNLCVSSRTENDRTAVCQCGIVSALMWHLVRDRLFADAVSESLFTSDQ